MSYYEHFNGKDAKPGPAAKRSRLLISKLRHSTWVFWIAIMILLIGAEAAMQGRAASSGAAQPSDRNDMQILADWIFSLQYRDDFRSSSYGAIRIHHTAGCYSSGVGYYRVSPYDANLGVTGLLRAPIMGKLDVAEAWIQWQLNHVDRDAAPGVVFDHWYQGDGSGETTCPSGIDPTLCNNSDSPASFAATFLGMAWTYYNAGGSIAFLNAPGNKDIFEKVADVILNLQQVDGLVAGVNLTVKYLMDNSEAYWGLKSMEGLEARVFNDRQASQTYARAAQRVQDGIRYQLLDPDTGLYRVAELDNGTFWPADLNNWYPGTVSLVWPSLFSVTPGNSKTARLQMDSLNASWSGLADRDWTRSFVDPDHFPWASIGYCALLAGDSARARAQVDLIKAERFPTLDWPFPVSDAGWLLSTLSQIAQPSRSN